MINYTQAEEWFQYLYLQMSDHFEDEFSKDASTPQSIAFQAVLYRLGYSWDDLLNIVCTDFRHKATALLLCDCNVPLKDRTASLQEVLLPQSPNKLSPLVETVLADFQAVTANFELWNELGDKSVKLNSSSRKMLKGRDLTEFKEFAQNLQLHEDLWRRMGFYNTSEMANFRTLQGKSDTFIKMYQAYTWAVAKDLTKSEKKALEKFIDFNAFTSEELFDHETMECFEHKFKSSFSSHLEKLFFNALKTKVPNTEKLRIALSFEQPFVFEVKNRSISEQMKRRFKG